MVSRRDVISGLVGAAVAPNVAANSVSGAAGGSGPPQARDRDTDQQIEQALLAIRAELEKHRQTARNHESGAVAALRRAMYPHLRANRRFPAYIEVGWAIWLDVYDWHIGTVQPVTVSQLPDGRYTLRLMQTVLVLRPEVDEVYIGTPFDEFVGDAPAGTP